MVKETMFCIPFILMKLCKLEIILIIVTKSFYTYKVNFLFTLQYGRDNISISNVNYVMQFKELKRKVFGSNEDDAYATNNKYNSHPNCCSNSKSKTFGLRCFYHKEKGHIRNDYPQHKKGNENKKFNSNSSGLLHKAILLYMVIIQIKKMTMKR
ncbi:hypothetical protein CR513_47656, partial [Mucuna pruriens]